MIRVKSVPMENPIQIIIPNPMLAFVHTIISVLMGIFTVLSDNPDLLVKCATGAVGMASGTMAFMYYREAWRVKKAERKALEAKSTGPQ